MIIRKITSNDTEMYIQLCNELDHETQFMMYEPDERKITIEEQRRKIEYILTQTNQIIYVAEEENKLIGFISAYGGTLKRNRDCVYIVVGIIQEFVGKGIGRKLFVTMENWAKSIKARRLELTVMCNNERVVNLYRSLEYKIEGIRTEALFVNGKYIDEYYMAKLI